MVNINFFNMIQQLTILFIGILLLSDSIAAQTISIDMSQEHQMIRGFGGMNHTVWINDLNEDQREKAFGNTPGKIGLSILRIHLDPNPDRWNLELPTATHALSKGVTVFATPWNAPDDLLDPTNAEERKLLPSNYESWVNHLNAFDIFMANNGVPLHAISIQNEPDIGEWTQWTPQEMLDFMRNNAQGIQNQVMAPESFNFNRDYSDPILNDNQANANLDIVVGHIYGNGLEDYPLARQKGKEVWMTEHLTGSDSPDLNNWNLALSLGREIHDCMEANFNAYVWWYIRRFYSLINDAGNITQKGYVMSHYAKFIRPGAVRVETQLNAVPINVNVSAYKTDTSFVMVLINQSTQPVNLDFMIQQGGINTLTKFTTSSTKSMINDGEISVMGGSFNTTLDARSITTLTTYAGSGPKFGNIAPTAKAGDDITIDDIDGDGEVLINLNASLSTDADGKIENYSWALDGQQVAWESTYALPVPIGEHEVILTVTDNDGSTDADTLHVSIKSIFSTEIWLEAECGQVGSTWQILSDPAASKGKYVATPQTIQSLNAASTEDSDLISISFEVTEPSNYKIWARVISPSGDDDSFWVTIDDTTRWILWNSIPNNTVWHWDDVHDESDDNPVSFPLEAGTHTLYFSLREDGALLDKVFISNTGKQPTELGQDASNTNGCEAIVTAIITSNEDPYFKVYPNPTKSGIQINWNDRFYDLQIYTVTGERIFQKNYPNGIQQETLNLHLSPGVYFISIANEKSTRISKLIIE